MPDVNTALSVYLYDTVYPSAPKTDLTPLVAKQIDALIGEATARLKAMIASAGASN